MRGTFKDRARVFMLRLLLVAAATAMFVVSRPGLSQGLDVPGGEVIGGDDGAPYPNDTYFGSSGAWGQGFQDQWGLYSMHVPDAWLKTLGDLHVIIAVLDTGVDYKHVELKDKLWFNSARDPVSGNGEDKNGNGCADWYPSSVTATDCRGVLNRGDIDHFDDDRNTYVDDVGGMDVLHYSTDTANTPIYRDNDDDGPADDRNHGTQIAGIIGAATNNGHGIAGVCPYCTIMPVRVANHQGLTDVDHVREGIIYAVNNGAKVINISLLPGTGHGLAETAQWAHDKGVSIIVSAGNERVPIDSNMLVSVDDVFAVGGIDTSGVRMTHAYGPALDAVAPASQILSLQAFAPGNGAAITINPGAVRVGADLAFFSGTSEATAFISGVVGLMLSVNPDLSVDETYQILRDSGDRPGVRDDDYGNGLVNAATAVSKASFLRPSLKWQSGSMWAQVLASGRVRAQLVLLNDGHKEARDVKYKIWDVSDPANPQPVTEGNIYLVPADGFNNYADINFDVGTTPTRLKVVLDPDNAISEISEERSRHDVFLDLLPPETPIWDLLPKHYITRNHLLQFDLSASTLTGDPVGYSCLECPATATLSGAAFSWTPSASDLGEHPVSFRATNTNHGDKQDTSSAIEVLLGPLTLISDQSFGHSIQDGILVRPWSESPDPCTWEESWWNGLSIGSRCAQSDSYHLRYWGVPLGDIHYIRVTFNSHGAWNASLPAPFATVDDNVRARMGAGYWQYIFDVYPSPGLEPGYIASSPEWGANYNAYFGTLRFVEQDDQAANYGTPAYNGWPRSWHDWIVECGNKADGDEDKNGLGVKFWSTGTNFGSTAPSTLRAMTFCLIDDSPGDIEPEWGVSVKMKTANVAPVMDPVADRTVAEATTLTFNVHGSDLDDDTITYAASPLPAGASLDPITGVFSWTPTFTQEGTYDVTFTASDGVASGSKPARLTVSHTNAPPVLAPIGNQTAYKGTVFCLHLSVTDPDGGPISYQVSALPPGATFDYTTGYLGWLLSGTATYASSYTLTLTAQDAQGLTDSETIVIYVRTLSCLLGGTEILLADGTSKPIEQVRPGDMVASLDETTGVRAQARVTQVMPGTSAMHLVINGSLRVTDRHPFLVAGQWLAAGEIMVGDALLRADGTMEPVRCIDVVEGEETVYDLTVEPTHTFFADGVLVHNKTPVGSGCQDPPDPTHPPRDL